MGSKIDWGYQPWQLRTYQQQKRLILQAGWEDRVDFGLDLYRGMPVVPQRIPTPIPSPEVLTPIDLDALETEGARFGPTTYIYKVWHIQHERPVVFHELISGSSSSSSDTEYPNGV